MYRKSAALSAAPSADFGIRNADDRGRGLGGEYIGEDRVGPENFRRFGLVADRGAKPPVPKPSKEQCAVDMG
jgi:hypothetical protein